MYCIGCGAENIESSSRCIRCGRDLINLRGERASKPMAKEVEKKSRVDWWWPDVTTVESATKATRQGMWAAVFVAAITAIVATVAAYSGDVRFGAASIGPLAFIDSAIFAAVAFGLYKKSRVAAVAGLVIFGIEKLDQITSAGTVGNIFIAVIIALCFIGAVRGTYALHRFRVESNG